MDIVKFDKEQKVVNMKIGDKNLKINCNRLDWENIISKFENVLENKLNVTPEEAFNLYINKIKILEQFKNPENDFWKEYKKLDHDSLGIPEDIYEPYKEIWDTKTWYDILGFKDTFYNFDDFIKIFRTNAKLVKYSNNWHKLSKNKIKEIRENDSKIPPNWSIFYKFDM